MNKTVLARCGIGGAAALLVAAAIGIVVTVVRKRRRSETPVNNEQAPAEPQDSAN